MNRSQYAVLLLLAGISGFVGGGLAIRWGAPPQPVEVLAANTFQLVDDHGAIHAALDIMEGGSPGLIFYDGNHRIRVVFDMTGSGDPRLFLFDTDETIRTILGLGLGPDGSPFIRLRDKDRNVIWSAP